MGHRSAKERHDRVTNNLVDLAAMVVHYTHQPFEELVDQDLDVLGVSVLRERRELDKVSEQHRDDPSLLDGLGQ